MWVVYGFGKNEFIESNIEKYSSHGYCEENNVIFASVCFEDFIHNRTKSDCSGSVYYLIKTNYQLLSDLVNYLNGLNSGFAISIIKSESAGHLLCYDNIVENYTPRIQRKDFEFGKKFVFTTENNELNSLSIDQILLKIDSIPDKYSKISRVYLEYLLLVTLRILDPFDRPAYLQFFDKDKTIIENIVYASNKSGDWHSIYYAGGGNLSVDNLVKCLNIENIDKFSDLLMKKYYEYKQDDLITTILNGVK